MPLKESYRNLDGKRETNILPDSGNRVLWAIYHGTKTPRTRVKNSSN
jgi:hypothetical protein